MRPRTARRIVQYVSSGTATHNSYDLPLVREAFRTTGTELTDELLQPWTEHAAKQKARRDAAKAALPEMLERRRERATRNHQKAVELAKNKREMAAKRATEQMAERFSKERGVVWKGQQPPTTLAAAAGREAFKKAVENEVDELPESIAVEKLSATTEDLAEKTVPELRQMVKERGFVGYSSMKKNDLISIILDDIAFKALV